MLDGRRKSMQPMAARLGVDHQRLQQFITNSPWDGPDSLIWPRVGGSTWPHHRCR
jgi:hypothetical protein